MSKRLQILLASSESGEIFKERFLASRRYFLRQGIMPAQALVHYEMYEWLSVMYPAEPMRLYGIQLIPVDSQSLFRILVFPCEHCQKLRAVSLDSQGRMTTYCPNCKHGYTYRE